MRTFLISPPFGNWVGSKYGTRVLGSFTWERRRGLIYHTVRSLRPVSGGWINQIGLRNPGLQSCKFDARYIYSLVGLQDGDWESMLHHCPPGLTIEVNLGCPNVHEYGIPPAILRCYADSFAVIAKLSPTARVDEIAAMCVEAGVQHLHLSNTLPTDRGGISGRPLFDVNLPIVERLADRYPGMIIAGGGIYNIASLERYRAAGATHFSLGTVWMTPWRVPGIVRSALRTQSALRTR